MKEQKLNYSRQEELFDPVTQKFKIIVLGAGSLGSFITLNLAKLGFNDISVYDYDYVEGHNIPNQFFKISDIGKSKVDALKEMIKEFADVDIGALNQKVTKDTVFPTDLNILYILTFDSLKERKMIFDKLKDVKCEVIDARSGGEEYDIQVTDTFNEEELERWRKSFDITPTKLPCGARAIIYTVLSVVSEVCNIAKKMSNGEDYPRRIMRNMKQYSILNDLKGGSK